MTKKNILFGTLIVLFLITASITILGVLKIISIDDFYLKGLFGAFLLELAATVLSIALKGDILEESKEASNLNINQSRTINEESHNSSKYYATVNSFKESDSKEIRLMIVGVIHSSNINVRDGGPAWETPEKAWEHWQTFVFPKLSPSVIKSTDVFIIRHDSNSKFSNRLKEILESLFPKLVIRVHQAGNGKSSNQNVSIHVSGKNLDRFKIE